MYPLKRIAAYVIDYAIILFPTMFAVKHILLRLGSQVPDEVRMHLSMAIWGISLLAPAVILGVITGLTGTSPGKFITFLRVQDHGGDPPGIANGIIREVAKAVSTGFLFGMFYALQAVVTRRRTFYDEWLDLDVEDLRPVGLTPTQKNFRKYMREKQRRERR
ncbi:RDD family protein [Singulisphaera sp. PoT]|uniref:RDD family protein n=1 Tax=Singulisphaera sp. PoT TaxID=3411797 RepID=UPI003BF49AF4